MRILVVGTFLSKFGMHSVSEDVAAMFRRAGHEVIGVSDKKNKPLRLLDVLATVFFRRAAYQVAQVDVYSTAAFIWAEAACAVMRRLGKPYVLSLHGGNLPQFAERSPERVRRLLGSARAITAPSAFLQEAMQPYASQPILRLPNPIPLANYPHHVREGARPSLVWLRAFHHMYNPSMAVDVIAGLRGEFPDIHLTMVGPDKGDGSLQGVIERAAALGVNDRITFTGAIPKAQVPGVLSQHDVFLNTTNVDNTPVSVVEAMACGLCVVSTDVGGLRFLLTDGEDSLLIPPASPEAMMAAVRRVLTDPALAAHLSARAIRRAEECSETVVEKRWLALFDQVLAG